MTTPRYLGDTMHRDEYTDFVESYRTLLSFYMNFSEMQPGMQDQTIDTTACQAYLEHIDVPLDEDEDFGESDFDSSSE